MLINTPSHVYWGIIKQLGNLRTVDVSDSVIITSSNDEIVNHVKSDYVVKGHHHVLVENPVAINELLKKFVE